MSNFKIGDNKTSQKHFKKFFPPLLLNNVEVQKLYKTSEMCWAHDSQHCFFFFLGGGGGGRKVVIIDVLLKIWLSVPDVLARIVGINVDSYLVCEFVVVLNSCSLCF